MKKNYRLALTEAFDKPFFDDLNGKDLYKHQNSL